MIKIICAWCGKTLKEGREEGLVTHLICSSCYEKEMQFFEAKQAKSEENNQAEKEKPDGNG